MDTKAAEYLARAQEARKAASEARQADIRDAFLKVAAEWERMAGQTQQGPAPPQQDKALAV